jgi:hypothetical protein
VVWIPLALKCTVIPSNTACVREVTLHALRSCKRGADGHADREADKLPGVWRNEKHRFPQFSGEHCFTACFSVLGWRGRETGRWQTNSLVYGPPIYNEDTWNEYNWNFAWKQNNAVNALKQLKTIIAILCVRSMLDWNLLWPLICEMYLKYTRSSIASLVL